MADKNALIDDNGERSLLAENPSDERRRVQVDKLDRLIVSPASADAFQRGRVSNPTNLFDSKQIFDNQPLFWDEVLESGAGITATHATAEAATTISSTNSTAGKFTRQTFMRFNYQPGKSQLIYMTGVLDKSGGGTGTQRRIGYFDDNNGLFFEDDEGTIKVVRRTKVTGTVVNNKVAQSSWNIDKVDGTGASGLTADFTQAQVFVIDFEWLGVGRVRFGLIIDGLVIYVHEFLNANTLSTVYMSTPNLPLRYQLETTSSSATASILSMCSTVVSEGGSEDLGILRYKSTEGTHVDADNENQVYAIVGLKLKSTHVAASVKLIDAAIQIQTASNKIEWILMLNPTIGGTFTYSDEENSSVQTALGTSTSTASVIGTIITGGYVESGGNQAGRAGSGFKGIQNAILLGSSIVGTADAIVLAVRPIGSSTNVDVEGSLTWREI